ncbi:unannotated protein [freshwater metagenome]|uniref:Unannotated protein n=1 Tax=freshwater metagenome TaxID=449393 RepID=A0A6J7DG67_9ZZZZ|nr:hypothetical protein [Actinomycetota bacterium]
MGVIPFITGAAGGGSSSFGGGSFGGGGGFSGGGGGRYYGGSGGGIYVGSGGGWVVLAIILIVIAVVLLSVINTWLVTRQMRRRLDERDAQVRRAAAQAAEDDAAFALERVVADTGVMFHAIQGAWDARDQSALERLVGPDLMVEWRRRLTDFDRRGWHNRVRVISGPAIRYVGLTNREDDAEDRVVVNVEASLEDYVESGGRRVMRSGTTASVVELREYWTLAKREGRWILTSIEQNVEGAHNLSAPLVPSPWADERVRDEAVLEGAAAGAPIGGMTTSDLISVSLAEDASAQALDLSLADARFAPDVLSVAARRAAEAWAEAVDGDDAPLNAVATPAAVAALLYGGDAERRTRLVVRGPRIEQVTVELLLPTPEPARMLVGVRVRGRRYIEDRDTAAVVSGSRDAETTFTERWMMALDGPETMPWRLTGVGA